jgi:hypothetical protein
MAFPCKAQGKVEARCSLGSRPSVEGIHPGGMERIRGSVASAVERVGRLLRGTLADETVARRSTVEQLGCLRLPWRAPAGPGLRSRHPRRPACRADRGAQRPRSPQKGRAVLLPAASALRVGTNGLRTVESWLVRLAEVWCARCDDH